MAASATGQQQAWDQKAIPGFYLEDVPEHLGPAREFLEKYSGIPPEDVDNHLRAIRDRLWAVAKYRCIGHWRFANVDAVDPELYQEALGRLKADGSQDALLDLACCVGQVVRKFASDGADPARLYGADLHPEFIEIGYDLFRDRGRLGATFVAGDLFDPADPGLAQVRGKVTIVHAQAFFHLFDWEGQAAAAERVVSLLRPGAANPMIFGHHVGSTRPREIHNVRGGTRYVHDVDSFQRMWDDVGARTGTKWRVEGELKPRSWRKPDADIPEEEKDICAFRYVVYRAQ